MNLIELNPGKKIPEVFYVVIEIPKGSNIKYEFDKNIEMIKADRIMHSPFVYPFNYGFIPKTKWIDNDALDVMILGEKLYPYTVIEVRPIGSLFMNDNGWKDDKILAVPTKDPRFKEIKSIKDLPSHLLKEIKHFFKHYKDLEGKEVKGLKWSSANEAKSIIKRALKIYENGNL